MKKIKRHKRPIRQKQPAKMLLIIFKSGQLKVMQIQEIQRVLTAVLPKNFEGFVIPDSTFNHAQLINCSTGQMTAIPKAISEKIGEL